MKILLISSSPRKKRSQTFLLATEVLKGCADAETETVHLFDFEIKFCRHCEVCHKKILACPIKDDVQMILGKMLEADGILLASPDYINHVTAGMKALFDRSSHIFHCQRLFGKYTGSVATAGSGPHEMVLDYMHDFSTMCGAQYVGGVSTVIPVTEAIKKKAREVGRDLAEAFRKKKEFPQEMEAIQSQRSHFRKITEAHKKEWIAEYQYWVERGWL